MNDIKILKAEYIGFEHSSFLLKKLCEEGAENFKINLSNELIKKNVKIEKEIPPFLPPYSKSIINNENYKKATLMYPFIVNMSFSIELLLKILIFYVFYERLYCLLPIFSHLLQLKLIEKYN